ncbi:MAG: ABC transporter ATP-binding protein [Gemmobacter sp.]|jgi:iron complex transport system ATP-binding protein|nr:ABC transporter ATP-binding protein [Gemmobacter sp.]
MTLLRAEGLMLRRGGRLVLDGADLVVAEGEFVGLIGPNGAGKTTLMRAALGLVPARGYSDLATLPPARRARRAAWLPQAREIAWPVPVAHLVGLGAQAGGRDAAAVTRALERTGLAAFADRRATELSGGEQARALIARALAQETPLLLADEPIAGLDPAQQIRSMEVFRALAGEGRAVLASLHDLGLAARYCTRLVAMNAGRVVASGPPADVLTPELMRAVFGVTAFFADTPDGPVFQPLSVL